MKRKVTNEEFIKAYGNLSATPSQLTKEQLDNRNIIYSVTSKFSKALTYDERVECGLEGMWGALNGHIDGKGNKFTTSLWKFTYWACQHLLRSKKRKGVINTISVENVDVVAKSENPEVLFVRECLAKLPESHAKLITQYHLEGHTMEEIGKLNGYSKETARQKINKALSKLKQICTKARGY